MFEGSLKATFFAQSLQSLGNLYRNETQYNLIISTTNYYNQKKIDKVLNVLGNGTIHVLNDN